MLGRKNPLPIAKTGNPKYNICELGLTNNNKIANTEKKRKTDNSLVKLLRFDL